MISQNLHHFAAGSLGPAWQRASAAALEGPMVPYAEGAAAVADAGLDAAQLEVATMDVSSSDVDDDMLAQHALLSESGLDVNGDNVA